MVMEAAPAAALEMAEPDLLLQLPIVALDAPAQLDQLDHALQRHVLGQGRQPEVSRPRLVLGPLDDQPFLGPRLRALVIPVRRPHAQPGEARAQGGVGALAPRHRMPACRVQAVRQRRHRLRRGAGGPAQVAPRSPPSRRCPRRQQGRGGRRPHTRRGVDGQAIDDPQRRQLVADIGCRCRTTRHQGDAGRQAHGQRLADLLQGDLGLGAKIDVVGNAGLAAPRRVPDPVLGQVQTPGHRQAGARARHRQRDRHLAVLGLAQLAAVLPRHAHRMASLLGKRRIVDDPGLDAARRLQRRQNLIADRFQDPVVAPRRLADKVKQGLMRRAGVRRRQPRRHGLHALARHRQKQSRNVAAERLQTVRMPQDLAEAVHVGPETRLHRRLAELQPHHRTSPNIWYRLFASPTTCWTNSESISDAVRLGACPSIQIWLDDGLAV